MKYDKETEDEVKQKRWNMQSKEGIKKEVPTALLKGVAWAYLSPGSLLPEIVDVFANLTLHL